MAQKCEHGVLHPETRSAPMSSETQEKAGVAGDGASEGRRDSLSVTDNRTGKSYEIPIENGAIRAPALRDIKVDEEDFGLLSYDPAFMNPESTRSEVTFLDGERGIPEYRG